MEWFIDRYTGRVDRMDITDATELSLRRGRRGKNDPDDALDIVPRLSRGECPLGYIADSQLMQLRKLGRHLRRLSQMPSKVKHCMKSLLNAANTRGPQFDGARPQKWFIAFGYLLQPAQQDAFCDYLELLMFLERRRETLRRKILTANRSAVFSSTEAIIKTVPGIGPIRGLTIAAEIGPFDRFPSADALEFWASPRNLDVRGSAAQAREYGAPTRPMPNTNATQVFAELSSQELICRQQVSPFPRPP